jgi:hypothetical protein
MSCYLILFVHFGGTFFLDTENVDCCVLYCDLVQSGRELSVPWGKKLPPYLTG